jgi:hypothetical protein
MSRLAANIEPLAEEIVKAKATLLAGLRSKALAVLEKISRAQVAPLDFLDGGGASLSLLKR